MLPGRRTRRTQNRRASEARPSARCTAPPSRTAPQTPEARPSDPLLDRPGYATLRRERCKEHLVNLSRLDRDISKTSELPPSLQLQIKNTGVTPAYNVISLTGGALLDFPSHFDLRDITIALGMSENASVYFLPNGGASLVFVNVAGAPLPLTIE